MVATPAVVRRLFLEAESSRLTALAGVQIAVGRLLASLV